jgi:hypothetical protein
MDIIWTYHNSRYHENNIKQFSRYKIEALNRRYKEIICENHADLVERLHDFQTKHFEDIKSIGNLNYGSKHCLEKLAYQYIVEAALAIQTEIYNLSKFLGARLGVGCTGHIPGL